MHKQLLDKEKQRFYPLTDDKSLVNINTINDYQIECLFNPVVDDIIVTPSELTLADGLWGTVSVEISPSRARDVAAVTYSSDGEVCGDSSTISVCWNDPGEHVLHVNELSEDITKLVKASVYKAPKLTAIPNIPSFGSIDTNRTYVSKNLSVYEVGVFLNDGCTFTLWSDGNTDLHRIIEIQEDSEITAILSCPDAVINYTTNNNAIVLPSNDAFEVDIIDNTYHNEIGTLTFNEPITSIGNRAFGGCSSLTSITIPNSVTSIGNGAFEGCSSLTSIAIPNSVTSIRGHAFNGCSSLTSIVIPDGVTYIHQQTFYNCSSLTSITIPNSVTDIAVAAFSGCSSLTSVTIPNSVTSIGDYAFQNCSSLTSVTIGKSVTSIGNKAFENCSSLTSITCKATTPPTVGSSNELSNITAIYVPYDAVDNYKTADYWKNYAHVIQPIQS